MAKLKNIYKVHLTFLLMLIYFILPLNTMAQDKDEFISVLIIDKTKSMIGFPGQRGTETDIWDDVQNYLYEYIDGLQLNLKLLVYEFDQNIYGPEEFSVNNSSDKESIKNYIRSIEPNGRNTGIYDALFKATNYINNNYPENRKLIYLITDGKDNSSQISFSEMVKEFDAQKGEFDHLYYIDLRDQAPPEVRNSESIKVTKGFTKFVTLEPVYNPIPAVLDGQTGFVQDFLINGFDLPDNFSFSVRLEVNPELNINLDLRPSASISKNQLQKLEDGKYRGTFNLELLAGRIDKPATITARLNATDPPEYVYTFNPNHFEINLELNIPKVVVPKGGWK